MTAIWLRMAVVARQNASEIVRPAAVLHSAAARSWRRYEDIADLFAGPDDPTWEHDRALLGDTPVNPWSR